MIVDGWYSLWCNWWKTNNVSDKRWRARTPELRTCTQHFSLSSVFLTRWLFHLSAFRAALLPKKSTSWILKRPKLPDMTWASAKSTFQTAMHNPFMVRCCRKQSVNMTCCRFLQGVWFVIDDWRSPVIWDPDRNHLCGCCWLILLCLVFHSMISQCVLCFHWVIRWNQKHVYVLGSDLWMMTNRDALESDLNGNNTGS